MNIAQVIATFPPYHGGMGYSCYHTSRVLAERGHQVTVFTLEHGRLSYENDPDAFRIVRLKTPLLYGDAGSVPQLLYLLDPFDVVLLQYPFFGGAEFVWLAATLRKKPYFLAYHMDVHGDTALKRTILKAYEPLLLRRIVQRASRLCGLGRDFLRSTKAAPFIPWNRYADIIYGGVDPELYAPRPMNSDLIGQYGLDGKTIVLFVGNLMPFKGLHVLIEAIEKIPDPKLMLMVVGGGYQEETYKAMVAAKGLQQRVLFAGPQSPTGLLPDFYNLADFLVLPSTHSESLGLVTLEAMATGKPVIVSALPGPAQLVENGKDGYIAKVGDADDLADKIKRLAASKQKCRAMGAAARKKIVDRFTWEALSIQLETEFRKILAERDNRSEAPPA